MRNSWLKKNKLYLILGFSFLALLGVIVMQTRWVTGALKLREDNFNQKVSMALFHAIDILSENNSICADLGNCLESNSIVAFNLTMDKIKKEGSIQQVLKKSFDLYQIDLGYSFQIIPYERNKLSGSQYSALEASLTPTKYKCNLEQLVQTNGLELTVHFPEKKSFLYGKMSGMIFSSLILMMLTSIGFGCTLVLIIRQKRLAGMTTEFINNMTHEFKTPISSISLASRMIAKEGKQPETKKNICRYARMIEDENEKLKEHVEKILNYARLQKGEVQLQQGEANLHDLITNCSKSFSLQVETRGGDISLDLKAASYHSYVDEAHFINIITNLLDNANKYSPENPNIIISTDSNKKYFSVSVTDHGQGIDSEKVKHVFDKFYRISTGNRHDVKGFGLGLAYVKQMVEAHKGKVKVKSNLGQGSTFTIYFPLSLEPTLTT